MATVAVRTNPKPLGTVRPPARDLDIDSINLQGDRSMVARLKRSVTSVELDMTIEGASTLTIVVADPSRRLLNSQLTRTKSVCIIDNVSYTLVKVARDEDDLTLTFEETAINILRRYSKPRKANRKNTTRAQFIQSLVREPTEATIPFRCPELDEKQPALKPDLGSDSSDSGSSRRLRATPRAAPKASAASSGGLSSAVLAKLHVKGAAPNAEQLKYGALIVAMTVKRGGDRVSAAGAVATSIQESGLMNLQGGDRDSAGLYQQRPSVGAWGSYADVTNPEHAINAFLDQYLGYRGKGHGWLDAANLTQRSAYPNAPAQWYGEGKNYYNVFHSSGGGSLSDTTTGTSAEAAQQTTRSIEVTRVLPYEFSRGSADGRETSWQCCTRLADEVHWRFFARGGAVWYVSDSWLAGRDPVAKLTEDTPGVVSLTFDWETRRESTEATLTVLTRRYALLPGDLVEIRNEGAGSGAWLVSAVNRVFGTQQATVTLIRKRPSLPEPAPSTKTQTVTVGTTSQPTSSSGLGQSGNTNAKGLGGSDGLGADSSGGTSSHGAPAPSLTHAQILAERCYVAAQSISDKNYPYVWGGGHGVAGQPSGGGFDCSGSVSAAIAMAGGMALVYGGAPRVSGDFMSWGVAGPGRYFSVYASGDHVWIRWNGVGRAWRFDTSPHDCGHLGPQQRYCGRSTDTFVVRHWPGC